MYQKNSIRDGLDADAHLLFEFLSETDSDAPPVCDAVIGFGVFDLSIAAFCGRLVESGRARRIVFTGGVGAGSADLGRPEADAFADELTRLYPGIPRESIVVENRSTNTGENVRFTLDLLAARYPELIPGAGLRTALLVASPARLRRVRLTWKKQSPSVTCWGLATDATFETEATLHASKGIDYRALLIGEIDRLLAYPARGWIIADPIPPLVLAARSRLAAC